LNGWIAQIITVMPFGAWIGSFELRLRSKLSKDAFEEFRTHFDYRMDELTKKVDKRNGEITDV